MKSLIVATCLAVLGMAGMFISDRVSATLAVAAAEADADAARDNRRLNFCRALLAEWEQNGHQAVSGFDLNATRFNTEVCTGILADEAAKSP